MSDSLIHRADPRDVAIDVMRDADKCIAERGWLAPYMADLIEEAGLKIVWAEEAQ